MADLGAEVVKVEAPKGAFERTWSGCNTYINGVSVFFLLGNRNQTSIAVNLKSPEGRKIIYDLVKEYNQFYHDFSILREEDEAVKVFRLALSENVAKVVRLGMGLLGIEVPDRM